jgi:hypothetical protein
VISSRCAPSRRGVLMGLGGLLLATPLRAAAAEGGLPTVAVTKDPNCECCTAWVEHIRAAGFPIEVTVGAVAPLKAKLGVPRALASCHTAQVGGYVIEGHVPADAIKRLLAEKPAVTGLAVPGMPTGAPGMELPDREPDIYDVVQFGASSTQTFARYRGATLL